MDVAVRTSNNELFEALAARRFTPWSVLDRRLRAERQSLARGFDRLLALDELAVELYPHQRSAALHVLRRMRGRALLADEVGLGKTIEAGIILKEYIVRGLAKSALILTPATLTEQWLHELRDKFAIDARIVRDAGERMDGGCIIASLDTAKRPEHAERFQLATWDVVIVDEAHRLKNRHTAAWRFVDSLRKKYLLLLTATPIQNDLEELYNMMTLLKPGLLETYSTFRHRFMLDRRSAKDVERLREYVSEVMVRTTRSECGIPFPKRVVRAVPVQLSPAERTFYDDVLVFARQLYAQHGHVNVLPLILLLRELCSSPQAARHTLHALSRAPELSPPQRAVAALLADRASEMARSPSKLQTAIALIQRYNEPAIVFTEFRASQDALYEALRAEGIAATRFHGGMGDEERRIALDEFRTKGGVLISTEAGGEGQNLQFCRVVINFDLPWNPMRVEQRIGRVHRLGQQRTVFVVNMYADNTVETYVYKLLHEKIRLFQQVIGDIDLILTAAGTNSSDTPFDVTLGRLVLEAATEKELEASISRLGTRLGKARADREAVARRNAVLLDTSMRNQDGGEEARDGQPTDAPSSPTAGGDTLVKEGMTSPAFPVASLMHPLSVDVDFVRGALAEKPNDHPAAVAMHRAIEAVRFGNGRVRPTHRRIVHHRHFLFWFKVAYKSDETQEQLRAILIDPLTERVRTVDERIAGLDTVLADGPDDDRDDASTRYVAERLYRQAVRQMHRLVARSGRVHQSEANARLSRDKRRLEQYYDGLQSEALASVAQAWRRLETARTRARLRNAVLAAAGDSAVADSLQTWDDDFAQIEEQAQRAIQRLDDEKKARLDELARKYEVRAEVTPVAAAVLWAPKVECHYKMFAPARREIVLYYDPLTDCVIDFTCEACGQALSTVWTCHDGELVCSDCYAPCASCGAALCRHCAPRHCHVCDASLCLHCKTLCPAALSTASDNLHVCSACRAAACTHCTNLEAFLVV